GQRDHSAQGACGRRVLRSDRETGEDLQQAETRRLVVPIPMLRPKALLVAVVVVALSATLGAQTIIPTRYVADRFFAAPVTLQGDTLMMLMDTGGGQVFVSKRALERMGTTPRFLAVEGGGDSVWDGGKFPTFKPGLGIPPALGNP